VVRQRVQGPESTSESRSSPGRSETPTELLRALLAGLESALVRAHSRCLALGQHDAAITEKWAAVTIGAHSAARSGPVPGPHPQHDLSHPEADASPTSHDGAVLRHAVRAPFSSRVARRGFALARPSLPPSDPTRAKTRRAPGRQRCLALHRGLLPPQKQRPSTRLGTGRAATACITSIERSAIRHLRRCRPHRKR
jgi:hypothetical protein